MHRTIFVQVRQWWVRWLLVLLSAMTWKPASGLQGQGSQCGFRQNITMLSKKRKTDLNVDLSKFATSSEEEDDDDDILNFREMEHICKKDKTHLNATKRSNKYGTSATPGQKESDTAQLNYRGAHNKVEDSMATNPVHGDKKQTNVLGYRYLTTTTKDSDKTRQHTAVLSASPTLRASKRVVEQQQWIDKYQPYSEVRVTPHNTIRTRRGESMIILCNTMQYSLRLMFYCRKS